MELKPLKKGDRGPEVMVLQGILRASHFRDKNGNLLEIDGVYGSRTQQAVNEYHDVSYKYAGSFSAPADAGITVEDWHQLIGIKVDDGYMD